MKKYSLLVAALIFILNSCSSVKTPAMAKREINNSEKQIYNAIYQNIFNKNLDLADDLYLSLKTNYDNSKYLNSAAETLAINHMQNGEYILANFYLQEALQANAADEFAKFLLAKNQFLAAVKNGRDLNYLNRALTALKVNKNLVYGDYTILVNSMVVRVKLEMAWKNSQIGNLYKRLNKESAANIYRQKIEQLGVNIEEIDKK